MFSKLIFILSLNRSIDHISITLYGHKHQLRIYRVAHISTNAVTVEVVFNTNSHCPYPNTGLNKTSTVSSFVDI